MTDIDWNAIHDLAQRVGRNMARKWPGIEAEDMAQEALTALLEHSELLADFPDNIALLTSFMGRAAGKYASRERYDFTLRTSQYLYTPAEVRGLLTHAYWDVSLRETTVPTGPDDRTSLVVWENICIALWDLDAAFGTLPAMDQARLITRFRDEAEYSSSAARVAVDRAIDKLTQRVNERINRSPEAHSGTGSRIIGRMPAAV